MSRTAPRSLWDEEPADRRFMSKDDCTQLQERIFAMGSGGGNTNLTIESTWRGNLRWGRNIVSSGGDTQENVVQIGRSIYGLTAGAATNALDDATLRATVERAEAATLFGGESPDNYPDPPQPMHPTSEPKIWFDQSYNLDAHARGVAAAAAIASAREGGYLSAGYIEVSAQARSIRNSKNLLRYYPYTAAQFSLTVRDPQGTASGWAGVDFADWGRIDTAKLSQIALDKCVRSRNPVAVEPGRYTAILEPQALCDLFAPLMGMPMDRGMNEIGRGPFALPNGNTKIGQRVLDPRITVSADPMDPDGGFPPFDWGGEPYQKTNWIENGILMALSYSRNYAISTLGKDYALPDSQSFHISGGTSTIDEMIATTKRGILVTRFNNVRVIDTNSMLTTGNTRDGLWLVENGKIAKAIKNFRITESPLFILNNVEQLGIPQRTFRPGAPAVCPPVKVLDFSFTGLMDAV